MYKHTDLNDSLHREILDNEKNIRKQLKKSLLTNKDSVFKRLKSSHPGFSPILRTMKFLVIIALLCCIAVTNAGKCIDRRLKCSKDICYGAAFLSCTKTCNDCDGKKFKAFKKAYEGKDCIDAYPTTVCEKMAKNNDKRFGCEGKHSDLKKTCRKTCKICKA